MQKVQAAIRARDMISPGQRVLCGVSGGVDSTAMLRILHVLGYDVVCAHYHHGLRGPEADRDEAFVRALSEELGVPFVSRRGDVAAWAREHRLSVETAAREMRYAFLRRAAEETGCARIATAHTADDNAETVLFRLIRGAGARGLSGIPPVRDRVIRPLLEVTRGELEAWLSAGGYPHVEDSSNAVPDCARNALRLEVLPLLRSLNPAAVRNICAAAALLREDEAYLDGLAGEFLAGSSESVSVSALLALPKPVALRALRTLCGAPSRERLEAVYALCAGASRHGRVELPEGIVLRSWDALTVVPGPPPPPVPPSGFRRPLIPGDRVALSELGKFVRVFETNYTKEIHNSFNTFYFKCEKICDMMYVACRMPGDQIRLAGRNCTKPVRKLFSEAKVPEAERARRLVFSDAAGVVAVEGFGVAERCVPAPGDRVYGIEIGSESDV